MNSPQGHDPQPILEHRDLAADQIMRSERRMRVTAAAVDELAVRVRELDSGLARKGVVQEIQPGLGTVVVSGRGELKDVKLNIDDARTADPTKLGERILEAINAAEAKVEAVRERSLRDISQSIKRE
ncbi:YbaB/EbfC family nucleoid-associated protein [Spirillospora sp. CA-255316]